jgi:uncharacterized glyoxalase superfamily protein PhnB/uncharacterized protein YndB with AHSA1/START domain
MDLSPYLFFDGTCEAAFKHYEKVLRGKITAMMRYDDVPCGPPAFKGCNRVVHASLEVGGRVLMGSDTPPAFTDSKGGSHPPEPLRPPHGFRAALIVDTPAEAERVYKELAGEGVVAMPMAETFFAQRFGMLADKFGTPWMINCPKPTPVAATEPFVLSRTFDVSRDVLWQCFTDPARMQRWWGPKGVQVIAARMDLRPGGTYHYGMRMPDGGEMWGRFVYREIAAPERLVFVNSFSDAHGGLTRHPLAPSWPIEMLSTFSFKDESPGKSTFTVTWTPLNPTPQERAAFDAGHDGMKNGWNGTMEQLAAYLAKA